MHGGYHEAARGRQTDMRMSIPLHRPAKRIIVHGMNVRLAICACALLASARLSVSAAEYTLEHYKVIMDRAPFGSAPAADAQATAASAAAELASRQYRLTMLVDEYGPGTCAGIVDQQTQKSYVLFLGQPIPEGMELREVRMEAEEAVIRIGTETITLKISSGTGAAPNAPGSLRTSGMSRTRPYPGRSLGPSTSSRITSLPARTPPAPSPVAPVASPAPPSPPALQGQELEKHLREYNLQNIRNGGPPLPIQLTPEEDEQLVKEGVLPAR